MDQTAQEDIQIDHKAQAVKIIEETPKMIKCTDQISNNQTRWEGVEMLLCKK